MKVSKVSLSFNIGRVSLHNPVYVTISLKEETVVVKSFTLKAYKKNVNALSDLK